MEGLDITLVLVHVDRREEVETAIESGEDQDHAVHDPALVPPNEDAVSVVLCLQGGEALDQMRTENQNLAQSLAARAVHKVQAKRKPIEKEVLVLVLTENKSKRKKTVMEGKKQGNKLKRTNQGQRRWSKSLAVSHLH